MPSDLGYWAAVALAFLLGAVGSVVITTPRQVIRSRGVWVWLTGLLGFAVLGVPLALLLSDADYGYWFLGVLAALLLGQLPAGALRRWLVASRR